MKSDEFIISFREFMMSEVPAESTTDNLVEDLISNEDNERPHEDNPAQGEKDKRNHVKEPVTVGIFRGV